MYYSFFFKALVILILSQTVVVQNCQTIDPNYNQPGNSCATCDPNFLRVIAPTGNAQYLCIACAPNCQSCQNSGSYKCDTCLQGYVLNKNSLTCEPCSAHCSQCDQLGRGTCNSLMCEAGYGLNLSACAQCRDANCANCTENIVFCNSCVPGYALSGENCYKCPQYCATCSVTYFTENDVGSVVPLFSCSSCLTGYTFSTTNGGTCEAPTVTNSAGIIITLVISVFIITGGSVIGFYIGKRRALQSQ